MTNTLTTITGNILKTEAMANDLEHKIFANGGELTPEIEAFLNEIEAHKLQNSLDLADKVDSYVSILKRFDSTETLLKERAAVYTNAAKTFSLTAKNLKDRLKLCMEAMGITDLEGNSVRFKLSNAAPVLQIDEALLPQEYLEQIITYKPNKERIKQDLEMGAVIIGCSLVPNKSLRNYIRK